MTLSPMAAIGNLLSLLISKPKPVAATIVYQNECRKAVIDGDVVSLYRRGSGKKKARWIECWRADARNPAETARLWVDRFEIRYSAR